jgi:hypothetical protein
MIQEGYILGTYSPNQSAARTSAVLKIDQDSYYLLVNQQEITSGKRSKLELDTRLGTLPRNILLENSSIFISEQHHIIDKLFPESSKFKRLLYHFESKLFWALFAAAFILLATVSFFTLGVPLLSHTIAHALPESTNKIISFKVLDILDHYVLDESELPTESNKRYVSISTRISSILRTTIFPGSFIFVAGILKLQMLQPYQLATLF